MSQNVTPLVVAMITSIGALITSVITVLVKNWLEQRNEQKKYPTPEKERLHHVTGMWKGGFSQQVDENVAEITDAVAVITNKGKIIEGTLEFMSRFANEKVKFRLFRGIFDGRVLKIEYENEQKTTFQKGSIIGKLSARGDELKGKFIGYSPEFEKIIDGEVKFTKA